MTRKLSHKEAYALRILRERANRKQGGLCHWCKQLMKTVAPPNDPLLLTGDHLVPMHAGGKTVPGNIVAACAKCNSERHPEMNRTGGGLIATVGTETSAGPFDVLKTFRCEAQA